MKPIKIGLDRKEGDERALEGVNLTKYIISMYGNITMKLLCIINVC
jgi:hypothetical protein